MASGDKRIKKAYNLVLLVVAIVIVGIVFASNSNKFVVPNKQNDSTSPTKTNSLDQGGGDFSTQELSTTKPTKKLLYSIKTQNSTDFYSFDFVQNKASKVFTDGDETSKIKSIGSLTDNGKILVLMSQSSDDISGNLYLINTDGSGKKDLLINNFASPQTPLISPNGEILTYVLFSNSEKDFGFKLILANADGSNKKQLTSDTTNLILLSWSSDGTKICYQKGPGTDIYSIDISNLHEEKLLSLGDSQIQSLSWDNQFGLVYSQNPKGNNTFNKGEIYSYRPGDQKPSQLTSDSIFNNYPYYDGSANLAYLTLNYNIDDNNQSQAGKIELLTTAIGTTQEITSANQILGWRN